VENKRKMCVDLRTLSIVLDVVNTFAGKSEWFFTKHIQDLSSTIKTNMPLLRWLLYPVSTPPTITTTYLINNYC
jgi:hypothetical protein